MSRQLTTLHWTLTGQVTGEPCSTRARAPSEWACQKFCRKPPGSVVAVTVTNMGPIRLVAEWAERSCACDISLIQFGARDELSDVRRPAGVEGVNAVVESKLK